MLKFEYEISRKGSKVLFQKLNIKIRFDNLKNNLNIITFREFVNNLIITTKLPTVSNYKYYLIAIMRCVYI